jgi:hypothetical protein
MCREPSVAATAMRLVTADRTASALRYAALIALINTGESSVVDDLIRFDDPTDPYHINIVDAIGSVCTPAQFPQVLPLLKQTNAGLSSAFYHFRELNTRESLDATITYLQANPTVLHGFGMDSYLEPIIELIPNHWDDELGTSIGHLLATLERSHLYCQREKLITGIITHTAKNDQNATAVRTMIASLDGDSERLTYTSHVITPLITLNAAQWIKDHAPQSAERLFYRLPPGPARDHLDPRSPEDVKAHEEALARQEEEQRQRDEQGTTTRTQHQETMRTARDLSRILNAFVRLPKEHYPELTAEQRDWLAQQVSDELARLDLAHSVIWQGDNTWTHPGALGPLLKLTDYYNLALANDVPIVLALRSWPDEEIANYQRKHGLSTDAHALLVDLLRGVENEKITTHAFTFLRQTGYDSPDIRDTLATIAIDTTQPAMLRREAVERLASIAPNHDAFPTLANDQEPRIKEEAFQHLVKQQHQATIRRALALLTDDDLCNGEVPMPYATKLEWIASINVEYAIHYLRQLRQRAMGLNLWRVTNLITGTIAKIDKNRAATIIEEQRRDTPNDWQHRWAQQAEKLRREARIEAAQQTPFDTVIRKLKGATSMILVKVWCEGVTDRPVFRELIKQLGEHEMAETLDFVGGWGQLINEDQPERWLDGCRQAVIIMDGDNGRKLHKTNEPLTDSAKNVQRRLKGHSITLYVLRRYGIENYFPQHAYEAVLKRNLTGYFPIPPRKPIEKHLTEQEAPWRRIINWALRRPRRSFYQKRRNEEIATHLTMADFAGTDLSSVLNGLKAQAEQVREY